MAVDKNKKEIATTIMKAKGEDHDEWLSNKYQEIIDDNSKLVIEGLILKIEKNTVHSSFNKTDFNTGSK